MPAEIHKQVLDYQGGDANAALELVEKFKPLIKRYAFFLHREDSFEDLQRFLLSMLKTWDTSRLSSTDDATVTRYIANSVKNESYTGGINSTNTFSKGGMLFYLKELSFQNSILILSLTNSKTRLLMIGKISGIASVPFMVFQI